MHEVDAGVLVIICGILLATAESAGSTEPWLKTTGLIGCNLFAFVI